ncbi:unnamed protein product, partial [marine sediment metagenome]
MSTSCKDSPIQFEKPFLRRPAYLSDGQDPHRFFCIPHNLLALPELFYERIRGIEYGKLARERVAYINAQTRVLTVEDITD